MWASVLLLAQADPAALVERLGADDIEARQRAEADLIRLGAAAEAPLEAGTRHADPEVASRAARLLLEVVAPHRREAEAERAHLLAHLREAVVLRRAKDVRGLMDALKRLDPAHPLHANFSLETGDWEGCGISTFALLREIETRSAFGKAPDRARWEAEGRKVRDAVAATPSPGACAPCVRWRLSTVKVGLRFENARAEDVLAYLENVGGFKILLAPEVETLFVHASTLTAEDVRLQDALDQVLAPHGAAWRVTEEGMLRVEAR